MCCLFKIIIKLNINITVILFWKTSLFYKILFHRLNVFLKKLLSILQSFFLRTITLFFCKKALKNSKITIQPPFLWFDFTPLSTNTKLQVFKILGVFLRRKMKEKKEFSLRSPQSGRRWSSSKGALYCCRLAVMKEDIFLKYKTCYPTSTVFAWKRDMHLII